MRTMGIMPFNRILCAVDFSPESIKAMSMAESIVSNSPDCKLLIVYAFELPAVPLPDYLTTVEGPSEIDEYMAKAQKLMNEHVERINRDAGREISEGKIITGKPVDTILKLIDTYNPDMVIMGNRKLGFKKGILLGSVSARVSASSPVSVLIVR